MRKFVRIISAAIITVALALTLTACSPTCAAPGCSNEPLEFFGIRSDYCILHEISR